MSTRNRVGTRTEERRRQAARRAARVRGAVAASAAWLAGCASHPPQPLDTGALVAELLARTPASLLAAAEAAGTEGTPLDDGAVGAGLRAFDLADGLDAAEAEVLVLFTSPTVRRARRAAEVVDAGRVAAGAWQDPVLGIDGAAVLAPQNLLEYGIGLEFTLPVTGSARLEQRAADADADVARAELAALEWQTRMELRAQWARWSALAAHAEAAQRLALAVDEVAARAEGWREAGVITALEARLVAARAVAERVASDDLGAQADAARLALLLELGLPATGGLVLVPQGDVPAPPARVALDVLAATSPRLAVARARYAAAEARLAREVRRQYPDLGLGFGYGSEDEDDRVLFGLALPLPVWNRNARAIAVALAERAFAREDHASALLELAEAEAAARLRHERALARQRVVLDELVPLVDAAAEDLLVLERSGRLEIALVLETLDARRDGLALAAEAAIELARASADLAALAGPPTPSDAPRVDAPPTDAPRASEDAPPR